MGSSAQDAYDQRWTSISHVTSSVSFPGIPSESDSHRLLELFLLYLGVNQHFLDLRVFTDSMTLLYQGTESRARQTKTLSYVQYLVIMAIGRLLDDETEIYAEQPPGIGYFAEAMRKMPPSGDIHSFGIMGIEIFAVAAIYLQWINWPKDAYLYVRTPQNCTYSALTHALVNVVFRWETAEAYLISGYYH